jgi:hypothetical protein
MDQISCLKILKMENEIAEDSLQNEKNNKESSV